MKFAGPFILSLAAVSAFAAAPAGDASASAAASGNPYSSIIERNVFALVPIPVASATPEAPPPDPPLKITVNGIIYLFGKPEVLFKVTTKPTPGQPSKDLSYTMGEGERQDDITVAKIDGKANVITFDNHGVTQELGLTDAKPTGPTGGPGPGPGGPPVVSPGGGGIPMPAQGVGAKPLIGRLRGAMPGNNPNNATPDTAEVAGVAGTAAKGDPAHASDNLTPEERAILIEAQRGVWKEQGNPAAAILPPTTGILGKQTVDELHGEKPATPPAP